jgi:hypothetical protein
MSPARLRWIFASLAGLAASGLALAQDPAAPPAAPADEPPPAQAGGPDPIPEFRLPTLDTVKVRRGTASFLGDSDAPLRGGPTHNWIKADAAPLPKDREGIWVLEFSSLPVRLIEVDVPGKGRRRVHYLYYKVVNRTGAPRKFVPQFTLVTDTGKRYEDIVLPEAVKVIQAKIAPHVDPLHGAVSVMGEVPVSTDRAIDDAVFGVAIWDDVDYAADAFKVYVRGLSDGYQEIQPPAGGDPVVRYKALELDFTRYGDERAPHSREIRIGEPPYNWTYYP